MQIPITGVGVLSPFGLGLDLVWDAMVEGRTALQPLPEPLDLLAPGYGACVTAKWPELRPLPGAAGHRPSTMTRYSYLACGGIGQALQDGGVDPAEGQQQRGLYVAEYCNMDAMEKYIKLSHVMADRASWETGEHRIDDQRSMLGLKRFSGFDFLKLMNNMPTAHGGIQAGCKGPCNTFLGFAAAGLQAIGRAGYAIEDGQAEVMIAGGVGSGVADQILMTRGYRGQLSSPDVAPEDACRPFDRGATGIVPGEAGAFLVLGERAGADRRYGTLTGFGTGFAPPASHHPDVPDAAAPAVDAARRALREADEDPDLVVLSGWSWAPMDRLEATVHAEVLGDRAGDVPVICLGPTLGSTEAAAGPLGVAVALRAMAEGQVPPRRNLSDPIDEWRGPGEAPAEARTMRSALVLSLSPEGTHAAVTVRGPA